VRAALSRARTWSAMSPTLCLFFMLCSFPGVWRIGLGRLLLGEGSSPRTGPNYTGRTSAAVSPEDAEARSDIELTSIGWVRHLSCCPSFDGQNVLLSPTGLGAS
jgi:hypothetical protein